MPRYTFPNKVVIGLKSVMPIVYFVNSVPHKKVTIVYFDHLPWKLYCCIWSFGFRLIFPKVKKLYSKNINYAFNSSFNDVVVAYGTEEQIDFIKSHFTYKNFVAITNKNGNLNCLSNLVYNFTSKKEFKPQLENKYIPNLVYDSTKKIKVDKLFFRQVFFNIAIAMQAFAECENDLFVKTHVIHLINSYIQTIRELANEVNKSICIKSKKTINKIMVLSQEIWLIFNALSNYPKNDIYKVALHSQNKKDFKNNIFLKFNIYFRNFISALSSDPYNKKCYYGFNTKDLEKDIDLLYVLYAI